ncbi:MAG: HAMP domain-containing sensor histidine kinase [Myxococcota bacterium]|nr:HAMP domain-containing sensor histidine kinase [Myxococcota bacterium]
MGLDKPTGNRYLLPTVVSTAGVIAIICLTAAITTVKTPTAQLFTDAFGYFSVVSLPHWQTDRLGLQISDHLVAVDRARLASQSRVGMYPLHTINRQLAQKKATHSSSATLTFARGHRTIEVTRSLDRIGYREVLVFFISYALMGLLCLWSGGVVWACAGKRPGARAYVFVSFSMFLFFVTFYDYHTTAWLVPLFSGSTVALLFGLFWLCLAFPWTPRVDPATRQRIFRIAAIAALAVAAWLILGPFWGAETLPLRLAIPSYLLPLALIVLAGSVVVRYFSSQSMKRQQLRPALIGFAGLPIALGVAFPLTLVHGSAVFHLVLPIVPLVITLSIGHAICRYNIVGLSTALPRRAFAAPAVILAMFGAVIAALLIDHAVQAFEGPYVAWAVAALLVFPTVLVGCLFLVNRFVFPSKGQFRPVIQRLGDRLSHLAFPQEVTDTVVEIVHQWLPVSHVRIIQPGDEAQCAGIANQALTCGTVDQAYWSDGDPWERQLIQPLISNNEVIGYIVLGPDPKHALYTSEDLSLLAIIAKLAATALHKAMAVEHLSKLGQSDLVAARQEKDFALWTLSAEVAHEIQYPINFFTFLIDQVRRGESLDPSLVELGADEAQRLKRMVEALHRFRYPHPALETVPLLVQVRRAARLLAALIEKNGTQLHIDVDPDCALRADPDSLLQLLANLLRNAIQATGEEGTVEIVSQADPTAFSICIYDRGPGVPEHLHSAIFNPFVTSGQTGNGLGLAVCQRIARSLDWSIELRQDSDKTCFSVQIPWDAVIYQQGGTDEGKHDHLDCRRSAEFENRTEASPRDNSGRYAAGC